MDEVSWYMDKGEIVIPSNKSFACFMKKMREGVVFFSLPFWQSLLLSIIHVLCILVHGFLVKMYNLTKNK